jgi:diguanylate cyclase (GGDEF)-like protein
MKQQHIGFRDLLERLLPVDELPSVDRLRVQRALRSGIAIEVERAALRAMDLLEQQGALRRIPAEAPGGAPVVRYQRRDQHDIITLELPGPRVRDGVTILAKSALPMQAPARLDQVRRLVRLDDPLTFADPRTGTTRAGLREQLDQAGRELLGSDEVRFIPRGGDEAGPPELQPLDASLAADALEHHAMLFYCPDTERSSALAPTARAAGARSLVVLAVTGSDGQPLGLLEVLAAEPDPWRPADLALVALLAEFAGGVLERATRIEKLVFVDPLTTAYNRSYYDLQIRNEIARAQREQSSLALMICDIDDFKSVNTSFGYEAGNQVLVQVAAALRAGVRPFDTVARWGGEEFAVLLTPPVGEDDVLAISERLRAAVEHTAIRLEGLDARAHRVNVTVSVGVAMFPDHADNPQDLWRLANQALLEAKRPPKNQVVFYRPKGRRGSELA